MNPATQSALSEVKTLPDFEAIAPDEIEISMKSLLASVGDQLDEFEKTVQPTWEGSLGRLFTITEPVSYAWRLVNLLKATKESPALREAHAAVQPEMVALGARVSQSRPLYDALIHLKESRWDALPDVQKRMVEARIREAELGGVGLDGPRLARFKEIQTELAALSTKFSDNVLDSTKEFGFLITDPAQVAGIAPPILALMAKNAADNEGRTEFDPSSGPWKVSLEQAVIGGIIRNADDRRLRERVYRAYFSRASSGDFNNKEAIEKILKLRQEQASLLGYENFAKMNFVRKMAESPEAIWSFLAELRDASREGNRAHVDRVSTFAKQTLGDEAFELKIWDLLYWSEKLRENLYGFNSEQLRRYFPYEQVLGGLFEFCNKMFGVSFEPADGEGDVWDPQVRLFKVREGDGEHIAYLYLDAFARPGEKLAGAWANYFTARHRNEDGKLQLPSAWLVCNQMPPVGDTPSLMSFLEVTTLFHEVGHALHNMLTKVEFAWGAGNSGIEWDAVEIPSSFMENWCYDKETLLAFARDYETGEPMPDELFDKISGARTFGSGYVMANMVCYTEVDLELHDRFDPESKDSIDDVVRGVFERNLVLLPPDDDRFIYGFSHIFDGGYAAGYYTYLWSQMLSTDVYYAFVEAGRENAYEVGKRFKDTILALGASRHPAEIFREFRGRDPKTGPLLEHLGLAPSK